MDEPIYHATLALLYPINLFLSIVRRNIKYKNSVLHISYMIHIPYYTVAILRKFGLKADYLAVGKSPYWDRCDFRSPVSDRPHMQAFKEFLFFWRVVSKYDVIHSHFMITMSCSGWELEFLKKLGRKIVIHYRGCEIREREKNMSLHPKINICQKCSYDPYPCRMEKFLKKRNLSKKYGDLFLVTTPDLIDFVPGAEYLPLFAPAIDLEDYPLTTNTNNGEVKILHVTVHRGIEGTDEIEKAVENLRNKGYKINFVFLSFVPHEHILDELKDADLSIGKLKMGYYANFQIESMVLGVPAVTFVRQEFMTEGLKNSGFIFTTLASLEKTLEYYLTHPEELEKKRMVARDSILRLHNNEEIADRLIALYSRIKFS